MLRLIGLLLFFRLIGSAGAQTPTILLSPQATSDEEHAGRILQDYLQQMTRQPVALVSSLKVPAQGAVVLLGSHPNLRLAGLQPAPELSGDAYFIQGKNNAFHIAGAGAMGTEYGVYDLLERLGCRKYSPRDSFLPEISTLRLPVVAPRVETPAFPYRELHYEPAFDPGWARWHRLKTREDKDREWGMFVHTFQHLCPAETYFAAHPEYFSWNGAQRSPGQLCLTNDTVVSIVTEALRGKILERPDAVYWSVSQNDNYDFCKCQKCAASDAWYGSPAGTLLAFVNKIAAAFPDKIISTLAYQYTRQAPANIRPAGNVSICLCSIECNRGLPIAEGCRDFARDVEEWAALTERLMIWDYVVQFRSYVSPFPNWHTLQPNLQLFQKHGVRMVFEQGSGRDRSEFSDMRAYLLAKLMWNPQANVDSILQDFGTGYYGAAQPAIREYIDDLTASLARYGNRLWIYDIPQNELFLTTDLLRESLLRFLDADALLEGDPVRQRHLLAARLPVSFARVEKAKIDSLSVREMLSDSPEQYREAFRFFIDDCKTVGFQNLHERRYTPEHYVDDFIAFLEEQRTATGSIAYAPRLTIPASTTYAGGNPSELTNGRIGELDYRYNWLGFQGDDLQATVQLRGDSCSYIRIAFLQDQQSWVFYPQKVIVEVSANGMYYQRVHEEDILVVPSGKKAARKVEVHLREPIPAQYVRVTALNLKTCPAWHTCNGNPCWIFADELVVK
ncbi:MAG: DUF4838 domain-containing protein [Bacteroidetes bacterium]|nr:MAG: DUF4838 domain-containing protein [Bacteroidota bacterium]